MNLHLDPQIFNFLFLKKCKLPPVDFAPASTSSKEIPFVVANTNPMSCFDTHENSLQVRLLLAQHFFWVITWCWYLLESFAWDNLMAGAQRTCFYIENRHERGKIRRQCRWKFRSRWDNQMRMFVFKQRVTWNRFSNGCTCTFLRGSSVAD